MTTLKIPAEAWDSHMHVVDLKRFPLDVSAVYKPHEATLKEAREKIQRLNIRNLVFVQPSFYGFDNSCLLDCLKEMGPEHSRGVVVFDPDNYTLDMLRAWHDAGVRAVRINLKSVNREMEPEELKALLQKYDAAIAPLKTWAIQIYVDLAIVSQLAQVLPSLTNKVVVDHIGQPPEVRPDMDALSGWSDLVRLVAENDKFYVKISAPYRLTEDPTYKPLEPAVKALFKAASQKRRGGGLVFASDWPHTRFEDANVEPFIDRCLEWCDGDEELAQRLFRRNAEELWDIPHI